jgi:hypothetical protein
MSLDILGFFAPKLLSIPTIWLVLRLCKQVKGEFLANWDLRSINMSRLLLQVHRSRASPYLFRFPQRLPPTLLLWLLSRLALVLLLMVGLRWSLDESQISTPEVPSRAKR